ncbi:MAG: winged helix-turn-helix domain-containing protein [Armatimonadetes bacterium]|nr:winged helix-turn-helix domain-containing protein [Armatimonadota bacterium]
MVTETSYLVLTKLFPSVVSENLLRRERLIEKFTTLYGPRLVILWGEAGTGKTSLLFDYVRSLPQPPIWYSLGESDQDLQVFLTYLLTGVERTFPDFPKNARKALEKSENISADWSKILAELVNDGATYRHTLLFVLDDFQYVTGSPEVMELMKYFVRNAPPRFRFIVASREEPLLDLPYLRAKGLLQTIPREELLFTRDEVKALFEEVWKFNLTEPQVDFLYHRTEGWVTALQLVYQALREKSSGEFEQTLRVLGSFRNFVYEYLAAEILHQQPREVQQFLKMTSILSQFDMPLVRTVTGMSDSDQIFQQVVGKNLFVIPLDDEKRYYRYHHLFGEFLSNKLQEEDPEKVKPLHLAAASCLEKGDTKEEAIGHYLAGQDYAHASRLLVDLGAEMIQKGQVRQLHHWIAALPAGYREESPLFHLFLGQIAEHKGEWVEATEEYQRGLAHFRKSRNGPRVVEALEHLATCYAKYGDSVKMLQACEEALAQARESGLTALPRLHLWLGSSLVDSGSDWSRGYSLIEEGHRLARKSGSAEDLITASMTSGILFHFGRGDFDEALKVLNEGILCSQKTGRDVDRYQLLLNKMTVVLFAGDLLEAKAIGETVLRSAKEIRSSFVAQGFRMLMATTHLELHDLDQAREYLEEIDCETLPAQFGCWTLAAEALILLDDGQERLALAAAQKAVDFCNVRGKGFFAPSAFLAFGQVLLKTGDKKGGEAAILEALRIAEKGSMKYWQMKSHYHLASFYVESRETDKAKSHLERALVLTQENRYMTFWTNRASWPARVGTGPLCLCIMAVAWNLEKEFAKAIVRRIGSRVVPELVAGTEENETGKYRSACFELLSLFDETSARVALTKGQKDAVPKVRKAVRAILLKEPAARLNIKVFTFGRFQAYRNGLLLAHQEWGARSKVVELFKYLVAQAGHVVYVDQLMEIFWPSSPLDQSKKTLCNYIHYLRRVMNPLGSRPGDVPFLRRVSGGGYILETDSPECWCDHVEFTSWAEKGLKKAAKDPETGMEYLQRAVDLYVGDFLAGNVYDDWVVAHRQRLQNLYHDVLKCLSSIHEKKSDKAAALSCHRRILANDPGNEPAAQYVIKQLAGDGAITETIQVYESLRTHLAREFAEEPSEEIQDLVSSILSAGRG